jgi:hypothetical protein
MQAHPHFHERMEATLSVCDCGRLLQLKSVILLNLSQGVHHFLHFSILYKSKVYIASEAKKDRADNP